MYAILPILFVFLVCEAAQHFVRALRAQHKRMMKGREGIGGGMRMGVRERARDG